MNRGLVAATAAAAAAHGWSAAAHALPHNLGGTNTRGVSHLNDAYNPLGPGDSLEWPTVDPALVGLSADNLAAAVAGIGDLATANCLAVVKHGALVVDHTYPGYATHSSPGAAVPGSPRYIETMSAGKTVTAGLVGAAVTAGLFDLDTPMAQYGVAAHADFNKTGVDYFPQLTARHTLAQNTGVGTHPPGTFFSYDSSHYIAHLSWLLNKTASDRTNRSARQWATERFATPLGVPDLYANQFADPGNEGDTPDADPDQEICAGGDQPMTCAQFARLGLLLANNGTWLQPAPAPSPVAAGDDAAGARGDHGGTHGPGVASGAGGNSSGGGAEAGMEPFTLISPAYVEQMLTPQFPGLYVPGTPPATRASCYYRLCQQYSLLSYITDANNTRQSPCGDHTSGFIVVPELPAGSLLAVGAMMRYLVVVPAEGLVIATMGSALAEASNCTGAAPWTAEASTMLSQVYSKHLRNATQPADVAAAAAEARAGARARAAVSAAVAANRTLRWSGYGPRSFHGGTNTTTGGGQSAVPVAAATTASVSLVPLPQRLEDRRTGPGTGSAPASARAGMAGGVMGACYCYCGADAGVGRCFANTTADACADAGFPAAPENTRNISFFCPEVSVTYDCSGYPDTPPACASQGSAYPVALEDPPLTQWRQCSALSKTLPMVDVATCRYPPAAYLRCLHVPTPTGACEASAFFPPLPTGAGP